MFEIGKQEYSMEKRRVSGKNNENTERERQIEIEIEKERQKEGKD